jgi:hypothetical protein
MLAQSFPSVATTMLFPSGTTVATQSSMNAFNQQTGNALGTAAMQLGSDLALLNGSTSTSATAQLNQALFGSPSNPNGLVTALQTLPFGSTTLNASATNTFNTGFNNMVVAMSPVLGVQASSNMTLPTTGFTNIFTPQFTVSTFNSGFNNGFAAPTSVGFVGFGMAPTVFNTNFGIGFNELVSLSNLEGGFIQTPLGTIGVVGGIPVMTR